MKLQIQPNRASCLATAFAMCLDIDVGDIFKILGHDGTEIAFTNLEVPMCYRGFHSAELIHLAYIHSGKIILELPKSLDISHDYKDIKSFKPAYKIEKYLQNDIVMTNGHHAIAWDGRNVFDPNGKVYNDFSIKTLINDFDIFYIFMN